MGAKPPTGGDHAQQGQQALDYIDEVGKSELTVHLDTYHMNIEECDLFTPVLACGERLGYVHIGESHRGYLGSGTVNFTEFFHALHAAARWHGRRTRWAGRPCGDVAGAAEAFCYLIAFWRRTGPDEPAVVHRK